MEHELGVTCSSAWATWPASSKGHPGGGCPCALRPTPASPAALPRGGVPAGWRGAAFGTATRRGDGRAVAAAKRAEPPLPSGPDFGAAAAIVRSELAADPARAESA